MTAQNEATKKIQTKFKLEKPFEEFIEDCKRKHGHFDYLKQVVGSSWYDRERIYKTPDELTGRKREAEHELEKLQKELDKLEENTPEAGKAHKKAVREAIIAGREPPSIEEAGPVKAHQEKQKALQNEIESLKEILSVIEEVLEEALVEAYDEELKLLKSIQEKITNELEEAKKAFVEEHHCFLELRPWENTKPHEIELHVSWLMTSKHQILHKWKDRAERKRQKEYFARLKREGWTESDLLRGRQEILLTHQGELLGNPPK